MPSRGLPLGLSTLSVMPLRAAGAGVVVRGRGCAGVAGAPVCGGVCGGAAVFGGACWGAPVLGGAGAGVDCATADVGIASRKLSSSRLRIRELQRIAGTATRMT